MQYAIFGWKGVYFEKMSWGSETFDMTSEGFGKMFEGDLADTYGKTNPLVSMGAEPGLRISWKCLGKSFLTDKLSKIACAEWLGLSSYLVLNIIN